jgi:hypothetical protein
MVFEDGFLSPFAQVPGEQHFYDPSNKQVIRESGETHSADEQNQSHSAEQLTVIFERLRAACYTEWHPRASVLEAPFFLRVNEGTTGL